MCFKKYFTEFVILPILPNILSLLRRSFAQYIQYMYAESFKKLLAKQLLKFMLSVLYLMLI